MMQRKALVQPHRERAFTLFELLIALLVASFLIGLVYAVYNRAAKTFRVQNMALEMQGQGRFGLEHLRRDFANAGFGATVNTAIDPNLCVPPAVAIKAITAALSPAGIIINNGVNKNIHPIEFTLFGDYSGGGRSFFTQSVIGNSIQLQTGWAAEVTKEDFDDMFAADGRRYLRMLDKDQYEIVRPIISSNYDTGTVIVGLPGIPERSKSLNCGRQGFGQGLEVNSAQFIRYRLAKDTRPGAPTDKVDLVREEIKVDGVTAVPGTRLVIAEYVVDLNGYDYAFDDDKTGTAPLLTFIRDNSTGAIAASGGTGLLGITSTRTQDLRFMTLKLTVRTSDEDPDLAHRPRLSATNAIATFDVIPGIEGAARTLTVTSKVMLSTLAYRNVKSVGP